MSDIQDARPGDIYVDTEGVLWCVNWTCAEPTVGVERVEPTVYPPPPAGAISISTGLPPNGEFLREKRQGGISGFMWNGFERIYRKPS